MDQGKIFCQCIEGHCFLEKDAEWDKQNRALASHPNGGGLDQSLLGALNAERLQAKSEWMDTLGAKGTFQICCGHMSKNLF